MTGLLTDAAILAHADLVITSVDPGSYLGSPLYAVIPEHRLAFLGLILALLGAWWVRRRGARHLSCEETCFYRRYDHLGMRERLVFWLITTSAVVHLGLVLGHEPSGYTLAYMLATIVLSWIALRMLTARPWRRPARYVLIGSIFGYAGTLLAGGAPDQIGILTKLIEIAALAGIIVAPVANSRGRIAESLRSASIVGLIVVTGFAGWVGAMSSGDGGHHLGETPPPGVLLPGGEDREPTATEQLRADHLYEETVAALARFEDPAVAAAHGYDVEGMFGNDFHASNESLKNDGRTLDPHHPETLVYAMAGDRPVLLGAMFEMDEIGQAGPAVGGPLTVWHAHDHICLSLTPVGIAGLQGPFGSCPAGAINIPITNEMLHVWVLPGLEDPFGDIDEGWLDAYLADVATR